MKCAQSPLFEDLRVLLTVIRQQSFAAAAEELGQSPAYISKRIRILESTLNTRLLHRTTRKLSLTEDGEITQRWAVQILEDVDSLIDNLSDSHATPRGLFHICSSFGFGRNHLAPAISLLSEQYPELEVRLDLVDREVDIVREGFDLEVRLGDDLPEQHICKKLIHNRRILCATPEYIARAGEPKTLEDLNDHTCLVLKERNSPFGIWKLETVVDTQQEKHLTKIKTHTVKVDGQLSSNHGEVIVQWALNHRGIMLRSLWDIAPLIQQGKLVQVLPSYCQSASVWGVYPVKPSQSAKLRVCMDFLQAYFSQDQENRPS